MSITVNLYYRGNNGSARKFAEETSNEWLESVSDEDYGSLK